jgi:flagellar biosynthesis component FlhA
VVRSLLAERVPVVDLATILDTFDARRTFPVSEVVEGIRQTVRETLPGRDGSLPLVGLDAEFESQLAGWTSADKRTFLAVPREELSSIRSMLRRELGGQPAALVVKRPGLRPLVHGLVKLDLPDVPVLSRSELQGTLPRIERTIGKLEEAVAP